MFRSSLSAFLRAIPSNTVILTGKYLLSIERNKASCYGQKPPYPNSESKEIIRTLHQIARQAQTLRAIPIECHVVNKSI